MTRVLVAEDEGVIGIALEDVAFARLGHVAALQSQRLGDA